MQSIEKITQQAAFAIAGYEQFKDALYVADKKHTPQEIRQLFDSCDIVKLAAPHEQNQNLVEGTYQACVAELTWECWNASDGPHFILRR